MENFLGQLQLVAFNFAPKGWAFCNGQLLPINQNQALFALVGTYYGGNGTTTFALPNLQGRIPVGTGTSPSGTSWVQGEVTGSEGVTLLTTQIPAHTHPLSVGPTPGTLGPALGNSFAGISGSQAFGSSGNVTMNSTAISMAGGSQSHDNRMPYIALNWIIALTGIFPSRN